ncbi:MAG: TlpA family protein disulfide reductase [Muribaculaceae bacterium]|nr:TlpA family protein disulfide reductase [Muribaculaceae bacterium]
MAFNYAPDHDLVNVRTIEIIPDSAGRFFFPDSLLTDEGLRTQILVDNDYFGLYLEKGKSVEATISRGDDGKLQITYKGDNTDINTYYNALCQAFDSMKYFSPDDEEGKNADFFLTVLESETAKIPNASIIKDKKKREFYEKMRDRMYTWTKLRILMDKAYEDGITEAEVPGYVELVNTIDPNDDMSLECTLIFPWLNLQTKSIQAEDPLAHGLEQLRIIDKQITNQNTKRVMFNQLPYMFFAYGQPSLEQAQAYMQEYAKIAADYPEMIEKYNLKANSIKEIASGDPLPYDPVIITPEGERKKLSDLKGKVTYIDFWATWCGPCVKQIPYLEKLVEKMKGNPDVAFVSISSDVDRNAWLEKLKRDNPSWPQYLLDGEDAEKFFTAMNINGIPRFIILNADGSIANADAIRPSEAEVESQILSFVK